MEPRREAHENAEEVSSEARENLNTIERSALLEGILSPNRLDIPPQEQSDRSALRETSTTDHVADSRESEKDRFESRRLSGEAANEAHVAAGHQPPYLEPSAVREFRTRLDDTQFVRCDSGNGVGAWLMRDKEINGLGPPQIREKFALPVEPTHVSDVHVPKDTLLRVGYSGPVDNWGNGGGVQYELIDRIPTKNFTNRRPLST